MRVIVCLFIHSPVYVAVSQKSLTHHVVGLRGGTLCGAVQRLNENFQFRVFDIERGLWGGGPSSKYMDLRELGVSSLCEFEV
jgi:hypothetical protein